MFFKRKIKEIVDMEFKNTKNSYYRVWVNENIHEVIGKDFNKVPLDFAVLMWIRSIALYEVMVVDMTSLGVEKIDNEVMENIARFELGCWSLTAAEYWLEKNYPNEKDKILTSLKDTFIALTVKTRRINASDAFNITNSRINYYNSLKRNEYYGNEVVSSISAFVFYNIENKSILLDEITYFKNLPVNLNLNTILIEKPLINWIEHMLPTSISLLESHIKTKA